MLIALRANRRFIWVLIFVVCVVFTCVLPVYIVFEPIGKLLVSLSKSHKPNKVLTWVFFLVFGAYVYYRYDFLENLAPKMAFHAYQAGVNMANRLLRLTQRVNGIRSREPL